MTDEFSTYQEGLASPADNAFAITPADADLAHVTRAIYVGGDGDLVCILAKDTAAVTFKGLVAGSILPVRAIQVKAASTATFIVGLY